MKPVRIMLMLATIALALNSCHNNKQTGENDGAGAADTTAVVDNADAKAFIQSFLNKYLSLSGKQAHELAQKHLTTEFYSAYIEENNNRDNAVDLICEVAPGDKAVKVESVTPSVEVPDSIFIVQVQALDGEGNNYSLQYAMTVTKRGGAYLLSDSQPND